MVNCFVFDRPSPTIVHPHKQRELVELGLLRFNIVSRVQSSSFANVWLSSRRQASTRIYKVSRGSHAKLFVRLFQVTREWWTQWMELVPKHFMQKQNWKCNKYCSVFVCVLVRGLVQTNPASTDCNSFIFEMFFDIFQSLHFALVFFHAAPRIPIGYIKFALTFAAWTFLGAKQI